MTISKPATELPNQINFFAGFERMVATKPDEVCLVVNEEEITFAQLKADATRLGMQLAAARSVAGLSDPLPIYVDRSLKSAVGIFTCFYSGIPFTIIDAATPPAQATGLLAEVGIEHPIFDCTKTDSLPNSMRFALTDSMEDVQPCNDTDLAVVLLTSGSTGVPKGVMHSRASLARKRDFYKGLDNDEPESGQLALSPLSFAMGVNGLFRLAVGVKYFNLDPNGYTIPKLLAKINLLAPESVNLPSQFARVLSSTNLPTKLSSISSVKIGGEEFRYEHLHKLSRYFEVDTTYTHLLGSTEGGPRFQFKSRIAGLPDSGLIELEPIFNEQFELVTRDDLDEDVFEVIIGDVSTLGYFNNLQMNEEKFFEQDGVRWWRSGDLLRKVSENKYVFYGRSDDLVKVNGFLISPLTVASLLKKDPAVLNAVVLAKKSDIKTELAAFILLEKSVDETSFLERIDKILPQHLIPRDIRFVDEFPLTNRMKIDRKKLAESL